MENKNVKQQQSTYFQQIVTDAKVACRCIIKELYHQYFFLFLLQAIILTLIFNT